MATSLSVLIPTAGDRLDLLERSLQSLAQCEKPATYRETVVIENGIRRGVDEVVKRFHDTLGARYLFDPMANKSNALNAALNTMTPGLIVLLDDDVRLAPQVLSRYADAAQGMEAGVFFGGPMEVDFEAAPPPWLMRYLPASARGWQLPAGVPMGDRCFFGCNWAAFSDDLKRVGGFDVTRGPGAALPSQETEMQQRLRRHGVKDQYVADARVWHYVAADRCTPEWVVRRNYRRCLGKISLMPDGLIHRLMTQVKATGRYAASLAYDLAAISGSPRAKFLAQLNRSIAKGMIDGLGHRQANPVATQP